MANRDPYDEYKSSPWGLDEYLYQTGAIFRTLSARWGISLLNTIKP